MDALPAELWLDILELLRVSALLAVRCVCSKLSLLAAHQQV